jgi:hypothetical protein
MLTACSSRTVPPAPANSTNGVDPRAAQFAYPLAGTMVNPFQHFSWKPVNDATGYYLQVGTNPSGADVFAVGNLPANVTSWAVDNLLPGVTYYATLKTILPENQFAYAQQSFTVASTVASRGTPTDATSLYANVQQLTASVRLSAAMFSNVASPGTPLAAELALRGRTAADCTDYAYTLIDLLQQQHIFARRVVLSLVGNFWIGHTVVEYYDPFHSQWFVTDPTFGITYFDDAAQIGQSAADLSNYVASESWSAITLKLVTPNLDQYARNYYVDPVTLFLNIVPEGSTPQNSVVHDPTQFMVPASAGLQGLYLFEFPDSSGALQIDNPSGPYPSGTIAFQAEDGTRWSTIAPLNDGWAISRGSSNVQAFTPRRVFF